MRLLAQLRLPALALPFFFVPMLVYAALININTADATLLDTLPGIGPSKATAIVDYRIQHGPFAHIEDIQNVSGVGPSTFADIEPLITVGDTSSTAPSSTTSSSSAASTMVATTSVGAAASTYVPPPAALTMSIGEDRAVMLEVPVTFVSLVKAKGGAVDPSAEVVWSFGDGSGASGHTVSKIYHHAGTYLVVARARDGDTTADAEIVVTTKVANVRIADMSADGIGIANEGSERLDLSGWRLSSGPSIFRFPEGTMIMPHSEVLIPWLVMNLPISLSAVLLYPNGTAVAKYPEALISTDILPDTQDDTHPQPTSALVSYQEVQTVESALISPSVTTHESEALDAPTAAPLAAGGAAVSEAPSAMGEPTSARTLGGLLHSGWTFGFLGVIALLGGAFMVL